MLVRIYLKSTAAPITIELKDGVQFTTPGNGRGQSLSALISIGENEHGPVYLRYDDLVAIVPLPSGRS